MEAVPRLPMLSFELKTSPESTEFGPKLKKYINEFYTEDGESYQQEIKELEALRFSAVHLSRDYTGCSTLKRYFSQLHLLQRRFPMTDDGSACVAFMWSDIYSGLVFNINDIKYEQACILYNIGALHSDLGAVDSRQTSEGMKISCTHFQCAAWAFQHLRDNFPQPKGSDMSYDLLTFFVNVMLAQAQECILEKSMLDNRKSTIIAKVAAQIVDFYKQAQKVVESGSKHSESGCIAEIIGSKLFKSWQRYLQFKLLYHSCIAFMYMGNQAEEQQKMGERLGYLQAAIDKLNEAVKLSKHMEKENLTETLTFTMDVVGGKYDAAKKENDFIYHEKVPTVDSLAEIKGASLVKGIPFHPSDPEVSGADIFARLVPMEMHEASSLYSEEKAKILRQIGSNIDEKNQELEMYSASLQLDSLKLTGDNERLPQELIECCAALSVKPNIIKDLIIAMQNLSSVYHDVESALKEIEGYLAEDDEKEKEFKELMGQRGPSMIIAELKKECSKYLEAHNKASESNATLHRAMNLHVANLKLLSSPIEEIENAIPKAGILDAPIDEGVVKQLQHLLSKVEEMKTQRHKFEQQLREQIQADDITKQLVAQDEKNVQELFEKELKKHRQLVSLLEQNLAAQDNILRALTDANARYADIRKTTNDLVQKRENMIRSLINSYEAYEDLLAKSQKGQEFYRKLETNVNKLLQRTRGVCKVQEEERQQLLNKANKKLSTRVPVTSTPSATPKLKDFLPYMSKISSKPQEPNAGLPLPPIGVDGSASPAKISSLPPQTYGQYPMTFDSTYLPRPAPVGSEHTDTPYVKDYVGTTSTVPITSKPSGYDPGTYYQPAAISGYIPSNTYSTVPPSSGYSTVPPSSGYSTVPPSSGYSTIPPSSVAYPMVPPSSGAYSTAQPSSGAAGYGANDVYPTSVGGYAPTVPPAYVPQSPNAYSSYTPLQYQYGQVPASTGADQYSQFSYGSPVQVPPTSQANQRVPYSATGTSSTYSPAYTGYSTIQPQQQKQNYQTPTPPVSHSQSMPRYSQANYGVPDETVLQYTQAGVGPAQTLVSSGGIPGTSYVNPQVQTSNTSTISTGSYPYQYPTGYAQVQDYQTPPKQDDTKRLPSGAENVQYYVSQAYGYQNYVAPVVQNTTWQENTGTGNLPPALIPQKVSTPLSQPQTPVKKSGSNLELLEGLSSQVEKVVPKVAEKVEVKEEKVASVAEKPVVFSVDDLKERPRRNSGTADHEKSGSGKDPYSETEVLNRFLGEVERFEKVTEGLTKQLLNGPTLLEQKWKEITDIQDRESRKLSISVARCYPMKNRLADVMPYDSNRIQLTGSKDDYINASLLKDLSQSPAQFIATQCPLSITYVDFWQMVYEQQSEIIVCLMSDAEIKTNIYWPQEKNQNLTFGVFTVGLQSSKSKLWGVERIIQLTHQQTRITRVVIHLQCSMWPPSENPGNLRNFLDFIGDTQNFHQQQRSLIRPVVVHCNAGVGRTGVFSLVLSAVQDILAGRGIVDVNAVASQMTLMRKFIFQDKEQIRFCHEAILYHAWDVLMKRGILSNKKSFEEKLPNIPKSSHTRHPSQDFILGNLQLTSSTTSETEKPIESTDKSTDKPADTSPTDSQQPEPENPPPGERSRSDSMASISSLSSCGSMTRPNLPPNLANLDMTNFTLDPLPPKSKRKITRDSFLNPPGIGLTEAKSDLSDPLNQLDPLWTLKKN